MPVFSHTPPLRRKIAIDQGQSNTGVSPSNAAQFVGNGEYVVPTSIDTAPLVLDFLMSTLKPHFWIGGSITFEVSLSQTQMINTKKLLLKTIEAPFGSIPPAMPGKSLKSVALVL